MSGRAASARLCALRGLGSAQGFLAGIALGAALVGCPAESVPVRGRFVEDGVTKDAPADWAGEAVTIDNAGVTPEGGLSITVSADRKRVHAVGRLLALADTVDKPSADLAITDVANGFAITPEAGASAVRCGHGSTHGSAAGQESGCDALDVALPAGAPATPLAVTARSGSGYVLVDLGAATLGTLEVHGSLGRLQVTAPTTPGASITIVAETGGDVLLRLAADFSADLITLETTGTVDTSAFPDVQSGKGRGAAGQGARTITVRCVSTGAAAGAIVLARR
jgi:hypothetical protein